MRMTRGGVATENSREGTLEKKRVFCRKPPQCSLFPWIKLTGHIALHLWYEAKRPRGGRKGGEMRRRGGSGQQLIDSTLGGELEPAEGEESLLLPRSEERHLPPRGCRLTGRRRGPPGGRGGHIVKGAHGRLKEMMRNRGSPNPSPP